jgi:hypothetical protein
MVGLHPSTSKYCVTVLHQGISEEKLQFPYLFDKEQVLLLLIIIIIIINSIITGMEY